jgi:hypothetical protein
MSQFHQKLFALALTLSVGQTIGVYSASAQNAPSGTARNPSAAERAAAVRTVEAVRAGAKADSKPAGPNNDTSALVKAGKTGAADVKMDKATKDLGGENASDSNKQGIPLKPVSANEKKQNADAAHAINKIPGMNIEGKDLQPPAEDPEIKGFHPIKKFLAPVIRLGKGAVQLQQQMMKIEGPIGALQPAMVSLDTKLGNVGTRLGELDHTLTDMDGRVVNVSAEMTGIQQDLGLMKSDIAGLKKPLASVLQPLVDVHGPLNEVRTVLGDMKAMTTVALFGIVGLTLVIVFGTPFAAMYIYARRRKFFPNMKDHEFPMGKPPKSRVAAR